MKISKLLPLAFALTLVCTPAFADPEPIVTSPADAAFTLTLPDYISITLVNDAEYTNRTTYVDSVGTDQSSIHCNTPMKARFHVATNKKGDTVTLSAKTNTSEEALWINNADLVHPVLVFSNSSHTARIASGSVQSAGKREAATNNPNAIGFVMTRALTPKANSGAEALGGGEGSTTAEAANGLNQIVYTLNNGVYDFDYTLEQEVTETVSTKDEEGIYTTTLTMTHGTT